MQNSRPDKLPVYTGENLAQISFPLGGLGTGCVGLAGNGRLIDWEIFNRPNKNGINGFSHFAICAENEDRVLDARILHGDLPPPYDGKPNSGMFNGFGFGPQRETLAGLPHFKETQFEGTYPFAKVRYVDKSFPGRVTLTAFNPFIPLNDKDSGIPAAFFEFEITNTGRKSLNYKLTGVLANPLPLNPVHTFRKISGISCLHMASDGVSSHEPAYGDLTLATDAKDISYQQHWYRGRWFDALEIYWKDLTAAGPFANRRYKSCGNEPNFNSESPLLANHGLLAAHIKVAAGSTRRVRFVLSWNFPNRENFWSPSASEDARKAGIPITWRNYYATLWPTSRDSATYALRNWNRLFAESTRFRNALFESTLPRVVKEAASANLSILKSPTVMRLEDGTFYGFEGCHSDVGSCEGTCTHVWNYAQALPFLFPALERSVRNADYRHNQLENGGMPFRLRLPLGLRHPEGRSCADGLLGNVMMVYRDWKICGDDAWLREIWPRVKKSLEFVWSSTNEDQWDPQKTGMLWGRQHHTLDMELFGPSSWLCGFYLGALRAAAEMAEYLGDARTASEYRGLFERGRKWMETHLFNGEYYCQKIDIRDKGVLQRFPDASALYWDDEHREIKYQIGQGCAIDQVLAQYHASLSGLGSLFQPARLKKALKAIYRHNYFASMRGVYNPCRLYALNDEGGAVICTWPKGRDKPSIPLTYAQESMHGFEYAVACLMIANGMVREGLTIVESIRDRYDGKKRNPWNEMECGSNYARSMASYALIPAFSGFEFDMVRKRIGFRPVWSGKGEFRCFWSLESGWGAVAIKAVAIVVSVLYGKLTLKSLAFEMGAHPQRVCAAVNGRRVPCRADDGVVTFEKTITLSRASALRVAWNQA